DTESDEEMPSVVRSGAQDEGQAGSDPGTRDEGQAGPNPDDVAESLPLPTPCVLAGPNLEHSDVEITDPFSQPQPEHMDEGFTATAYPDVQENLKLTVAQQGRCLLYNISPKTSALQDTSIIPPMTSPVIDLVSRPDSPNVHWPLPTTTITTAAPTTTTTTTTLPLPPHLQQSSSESLLIKRMGELEQHIADRVDENQALESRLDKQGTRIRNHGGGYIISKECNESPLNARFQDLPTSDKVGNSAPTHVGGEL
ncbi:hypothetical protein Tco_0774627, partial [Tanacetum coccineum]